MPADLRLMATQVLSAIALVAATVLAPSSVDAAPVRLSYSGSVDGALNYPLVLTDHPVGTAISWDFRLDDGFAALDPSTDDPFALLPDQPTSGSLQIGAARYDLSLVRLSSYLPSSSSGATALDWVDVEIEGSGPDTAAGGNFIGLFVRIRPDLSLISAIPGFSYSGPVGGLTSTGTYHVEHQAVPLPPTLPLIALALLALAATRRQAPTTPAGRGSHSHS